MPVLSWQGFFITLEKMRLKIVLLTIFVLLATSAIPLPIMSTERISYIVIVAPGCETSVSELVKHRQNQGENVKVIKSRDILENSGNTTPGYKTIWNYLNSNQKPMGFTNTLLVGDVYDIPMPKLYPEDNIDQPSLNPIGNEIHYGPMYSDFYYQVLGIDWDKDNDGRLGEPSDDGIVPIPTISVGRIPFSEPIVVKKICDKIISYDNSSLRKSVLQAASIYLYDKEDNDPTNVFTDGADMMEVIWNDILQKKGFGNRKTLYEAEGFRPKGSPKPRFDKELNSSNLLGMLTDFEFGLVSILAHGETDKVNRKIWYSDENGNGYPDGAEIKRPDLLTAEQVFGKQIKASVVVSTACSSANIVGGAASLGSTMLRQGAAAYIGATAINYFIPGWKRPDEGGNQTITYNLTKHYCEGETLGWSLARTMKEFYTTFSGTKAWSKRWTQNVYSYILLGDPLMRLDPLEKKSVMPMSFKPSTITFQAGDKGQTTLVFGIANSKDEIILETIADPRFSVTFFNQYPLYSSQQVLIQVSAPKTMQVGRYQVEISCNSRTYFGKASFSVEITEPVSGFTELKLSPEYVYAKPNQEFWVDLIVKPTQPIMSISGILQYDPSLIELVDKRLGDFSTFDYSCPQWQVVDNKQTKQITFSFFRNNEKLGATSPDVAFSFCFKGKKESISDLVGISFDVKSPEKKNHIIPNGTASRIKIHPQGLHLSVSSKPNPANDRQVTLSGTAPLDQLLTIDGIGVIRLNSDGKFSVPIDLRRFKNDIVFKVSNLGSYGGVQAPIDRILLFRKTVFWPSRKELAFKIGSKIVWKNGQCANGLTVEPQVMKGSTMVPWRYISEEFGFKVDYNNTTKKITAKRNGTTIEMVIEQKQAYVNGVPKMMSVPPTAKSGTTLVPLRFVSESIGAETGWISSANVATVFFPK